MTSRGPLQPVTWCLPVVFPSAAGDSGREEKYLTDSLDETEEASAERNIAFY